MSARTTIGFAHPTFRFADEFITRDTGHACFQVSTLAQLQERMGETDILITARVWDDALLKKAPRLRLIQASSSGTEQFDHAGIRERDIRLASAQGVNMHAVSEHAIGLLLTLTRQLNTAHKIQAAGAWPHAARPIHEREEEVYGKTMLIVGLGVIGTRLGVLAKALGMHVTGVRRHAGTPPPGVDRIITPDLLDEALPDADVVVLTCPLTSETRNMINAARLALMKPSAYLINVGRGPVVDEGALINALAQGRLAGAGLDCFAVEPLPPSSPLWHMEKVVITPHSAGNTRLYERRVVDLLIHNLERLASGMPLLNQII